MKPEIILRALEPHDLELLYKWENNRDIWESSDTLAPFSRYTLQQFIDSPQDIYAAKQLRLMIDLVQLDGAHTTIGAVDLFDFDPANERAGVGILIYDKEFRQHGYATEALQQLKSYAFNTLKLNQLYCSVVESNTASITLFKKLGFEITGVRKDWRKQKYMFENEVFMQLLRQ